MIRITPELARKVNVAVRKECCNCIDDNCILLDNGEAVKCPQLISLYGIYCKYFASAVLPGNPELYAEIMDSGKKRCKSCGKLYTHRSKNQQYCYACAELRKKEKARERQRRKRAAK
ncbi:MAG: cysteine-rich VLP protein [Eubacteriales bacterium]|nr:cysteine-rich VLP protein [Eubacteriales bacterium]